MSTPVKFKELSLRNFMSYGNNVTTINLDFKEPKLIIGKNYDAVVNGQVDSNGSGKCLRGNTTVEILCDDIVDIDENFITQTSNLTTIKTIKDIVEFYQKFPEYIGKLKANTRFGYKTIEYADVTAYDSEFITITTDNGKILEGSPDHLLLDSNNEWVKLKDLEEGSKISTQYSNDETIIEIKLSNFREDLYDLQIEDVREFYANGIVSHNSSIIESLTFALYDRTLSNKDKPKLINNVNKKNMEVTLLFEKGSNTYKIIRSRKTKTKADVQLLVSTNGKDFEDKTPDSIANTNLEIERIVGLPFDVFSRIIVFSANFQPFLDLPSRHTSKVSQTSIMEELFGYTELSDKADALKEQIKGVKAEFEHLQELQEQIGREKVRHQSQIENTRQRIKEWEDTHKEKIESSTNKLNELNKIDVESERKLLQDIAELETKLSALKSDKRVKQSELSSLQSQIDSMESKQQEIEDITEKMKLIEDRIDFDKEEETIKTIQENEKILQEHESNSKNLANNLKSHENTYKKLEKERDSLNMNTCPYCNQEYKDAKAKYEEINKEISSLEEDMFEFQNEQDKVIKEIEKVSDSIKTLTSESIFKGSMSELQKIQSKYESYKIKLESYEDDGNLSDIENKIKEVNSELSELNENLESTTSEIETLEVKTQFDDLASVERVVSRIEAEKDKLKYLEEETNPHTSTLEELENVKFDEDKTKRINELDDTLKHQDFLLKLLTKKDSFIRKNLLDRSIPFLNKRLMVYLEKLGLPHRVEFQTDMTAKISQFGTELDFGNLSSGQKARVNLALAFAFRDVLQARHGKIAFCMLDECLDTGLGNVGVQLAAKMIKDIATTEEMAMFVISHRDEIASMFNNQMVVELKNGFSSIVQD